MSLPPLLGEIVEAVNRLVNEKLCRQVSARDARMSPTVRHFLDRAGL